jgi:hypothetical protein
MALTAEQTAKLAEWQAALTELAACKPIIERERELRKEAFALLFPDPKEGTNTVELANGWVCKGTYPIERKVDAALVQQLRGLKVIDLSPELLQKLSIDPAACGSGASVLEVLRFNVDEVLNYEPKLVVKPYRQLTAEQTLLFDRCLDSKPGSISMEITQPKRAPKVGDKAEGFTS